MNTPSQEPLRLSPVVAGMWRLGEWGLDAAATVHWVEQALALGITSFDHADIYGGYRVEALFGEALAAAPGLRNRLQLVTKCGIQLVHPARPGTRVHSYDSSRAHILASVDNSLQAMRTDRIDLLLLHRPDLLMDPAEVADTFRHLQAAGKVLHFGVSNHAPGQLSQLHKRFPLVTNQVELSPLHMQSLADGTLEQCTELGLRPMIWSPLARGELFTSGSEQAQRVLAVLGELAARHGTSAATVAYAWILRHPSRPHPITGSSRLQALQEAVAAVSLKLSAQEWYAVWQASMGHEVP